MFPSCTYLSAILFWPMYFGINRLQQNDVMVARWRCGLLFR